MTILLAVSGGIDSMYMANRAPELFPGARFAVAHCNFQLRGGDSDADEEFVRDWAMSKGLVFHSVRFDTTGFARQRHISTEMAARELRYTWFKELCSEHGYDAVALAHNANDNAETMMLNLLRGTGTRGLRGMQASRDGMLRPLLGTERSQIHAWMTENGLGWREDCTNSQNLYKRNIIRNEVFPIFRRMNPSAVKTLNADAARIAMVDDVARDYLESQRPLVTNADGEILTGPLMELKHWKFVLWSLLEDSGMGSAEFNSLASALESGRQVAGRVFGPVTAASGRLILRKEGTQRQIVTEVLDIACIHELRQPEGVIILDADKLPQDPVFRKWQDGDWMQPLGMKGRKKLSDLFTDLKWSVIQKEDAVVLELDGSHVAALLCCRIDESVKVGPETARVLRISYSTI